MLKEILSNGLMTGPYGEDGREVQGRLTRTGDRFHVFHELKYLKGIRKGKSVNWPTERASNQKQTHLGYPFYIYIQLFRDWGCRKKCTQQSRKVLWVVLSSLFLKGIWKNGTRGHGHMSVSATKVGSTAAVSATAYWSCTIWILPFGIVARTYFPTTFLNMSQNSCI